MADAREAVELDVVLVGELAQRLAHTLAQLGRFLEHAVKLTHGAVGGFNQLANQLVAVRVLLGNAALLHFRHAVLQGFDQQLAAVGVVQQVILQVGIALHYPHIAQHFVEHAGRAAGLALLTQLVEHIPSG